MPAELFLADAMAVIDQASPRGDEGAAAHLACVRE